MCCCLAGCNSKKTEKQAEQTYQQKNKKAFAKKPKMENLREVTLVPKAKEATAEWLAFLTARAEIIKLPQISLQEIVNNSNNIFQATVQLQKKIPTVFQVNPIESRVSVLLTQVSLLKQESTKQQGDPKKIEQAAKATYTAFINLEIQLNEVFLQSIEDFEFKFNQAFDSLETKK